ncbi:uncharacterized protein LOC144121980 [Amblyomma americanum]
MSSFVLAPIFRGDEFFAPFEALERLGDELWGRRCISRPALKQACKADHCARLTAPRKRRNSASDAEDETQSESESKFVVTYNLRGYRPEDISVKAVDNSVVVSARHEEESDDGCSYVKREFTRRLTLPEGVDAGALSCALSSSGVLAIEAPRPEPPSKKPRVIPITVQSTPAKKAVATDEKGSSKEEEAATREPTPES